MVALFCALGATDVSTSRADESLKWPTGLPVYDHIVIVIEENKDYKQVLGWDDAPYLKSTLAKEGVVFTKMYGEEHHSEGNYFWLFSGSNQNVGFRDLMPSAPIDAENLGHQLIQHGKTFAGFSEDRPADPQAVAVGLYARKHVPWVSFSNVPIVLHKHFADFPKTTTDFATLPTVSIVIPNLVNDMHNVDAGVDEAIKAGDRWLKANLDSYYQWAKSNNSLLIVTFDENDDEGNSKGPTDPGVAPTNKHYEDLLNHIPTIFAGAHLKPGFYDEGAGINHVNVLRTLQAMYGLPKCGAQQPHAVDAGIIDDFVITDAFTQTP